MTSPPFRISIHDEGRTRVIAPHGELDMYTAPQLLETFDNVDGMSKLILDLRGLSFMDSEGLRAVLRAAWGFQANGVPLGLIPGDPNVQRVFDITGTTDQLSWVDHEPLEGVQLPSSP
jgi:anti-anti-sigma factor